MGAVKAALDGGASPNYIGDKCQGCPPLMLAATGRSPEIISMLLDRGASPNGRNIISGDPILSVAASASVAQLLIDRGAYVNARSYNGSTSLMLAIINANSGDDAVGVAKVLVSAGTDVNAKNILGQTALIGASLRGTPKLVEFLIEKGADVNVREFSNGHTPLHLAVGNCNIKVVEMLLAAGADVNARDNSGDTPLALSNRFEQTDDRREIAKLLAEHGAK